MATSYVLEQKVDRLEDAMAEMAREVARTSRVVAQTSRELADFKREMQDFKREMQDFKREMQDFKREMQDFKREMQDFKREMQDFKNESRAARLDMNRRWGELSNKMGTMAEDLVAPSIPRILRTMLGCPGDAIDQSAVRVRRRSSQNREIRREFDVIASCGNYFLINETKSNLNPRDVEQFVDTLSVAREFFPEAAEKSIVGVLASLYVDESLVRFAERNGLILLGFGQDVMDVLNSTDFSPRLF
ncbi:MAG: hypothetical protein KJZ86_26950 [Caldilineaceae bacterium]|nr:hypothetical protein [Caldilineaceae bacterium]